MGSWSRGWTPSWERQEAASHRECLCKARRRHCCHHMLSQIMCQLYRVVLICIMSVKDSFGIRTARSLLMKRQKSFLWLMGAICSSGFLTFWQLGRTLQAWREKFWSTELLSLQTSNVCLDTWCRWVRQTGSQSGGRQLCVGIQGELPGRGRKGVHATMRAVKSSRHKSSLETLRL